MNNRKNPTSLIAKASCHSFCFLYSDFSLLDSGCVKPQLIIPSQNSSRITSSPKHPKKTATANATWRLVILAGSPTGSFSSVCTARSADNVALYLSSSLSAYCRDLGAKIICRDQVLQALWNDLISGLFRLIIQHFRRKPWRENFKAGRLFQALDDIGRKLSFSKTLNAIVENFDQHRRDL